MEARAYSAPYSQLRRPRPIGDLVRWLEWAWGALMSLMGCSPAPAPCRASQPLPWLLWLHSPPHSWTGGRPTKNGVDLPGLEIKPSLQEKRNEVPAGPRCGDLREGEPKARGTQRKSSGEGGVAKEPESHGRERRRRQGTDTQIGVGVGESRGRKNQEGGRMGHLIISPHS